MENLLVIALALFALIPLANRNLKTGGRAWLAISGLAALLVVLAWLWNLDREQKTQAIQRLTRATPAVDPGGGYVGSDSCRSCHPGEHASWHRTYHRTMTQVATPESVVPDFDDVHIEANGRDYHLSRRGDEFWVSMPDPDWEWDNRKGQRKLVPQEPRPPTVDRQVVLITGSHDTQVFWVDSKNQRELNYFPMAWKIEAQQWLPLRDIFIKSPDTPERMVLWNFSCIQCHTTGGVPRPRRKGRDFDTRADELGISCEACHGPGEEHVRQNENPLARYGRHLGDEPDPTIYNPAKHDAKESSQVCGQCHGIWELEDKQDFWANGFRYRPGDELGDTKHVVRPRKLSSKALINRKLRSDPGFLYNSFWPDGMVRVSGREYNAMIESPCFPPGEMSCLSCHSMHDSDPADMMARGMEGDHGCTQCHEEIAQDLEAHTHHAPGSEGSRCYNCHMPHTTYGLLKAIRSHEISSPTVTESKKSGRPNACNACHIDKPLSWTGEFLEKWYGKPQIELDASEKRVALMVDHILRGDAGQRALAAWAMGWSTAQETAGRDWLAPFLIQLLDDPYPAVRYVGARSLKGLPGFSDFRYDPLANAEKRRATQSRLLAIWNKQRDEASGTVGEAILIGPDGKLDQKAVDALLKRRNDRALDLRE